MKKTILMFVLATTLCTGAFAQRFRVGVRAGANFADYSLGAVDLAAGTLTGGKVKAGFEAALVARFALTNHLNLQTEFEFDRVGYGFDLRRDKAADGNIVLHANRLEIPLMLGITIGRTVRLFGGPSFRVAHSEKSSIPSLLKVKFNDSAVALTGGAALNVGRFFFEGRVTGYPKKTHWTMTSRNESLDVTVRSHIKWSLTAGVFF